MFYKILKYSLPLLALFILSGCSVWKNFTTYFNLYYNTVTLFEEAESLIYEQKRELFSTDPLIVPGSAGQLLNKVIEKSSRILQFHSESMFVDNALLMLGKSFYYQRNYQQGLRKFNELLITQPESDFILETQLWIAKSRLRLRNFSEGLELLREVRAAALEVGEDELVKEAFVEEIIYLISNERYDDAIVLSSEFLEVSDDEEVNADVIFELGRLYALTDDYENAIASYRRVFDYEPSYEVDYMSNIELGRILRDVNKTQEALEIYQGMKNRDKYQDNFDEIELERGITLNELGRHDEALEVLTSVDTGYTTSLNSGIARLKIGEIYQYNILNYDSAASYYQKASTSQAPPEYILLSVSRNRLFTKYNTLSKSFEENSKQLNYVLNPESYTKDSLEYITLLRELKADEDVSYLFELPEEPDTAKTMLDSLTMIKVLDSLGILARFDSLYIITELDSLEMTTILDSIKFAALEENKLKRGGPGFGEEAFMEKGLNQTLPTDTSAASKLVMPVKVNLPLDSIKALLVKNKFDLGNLFFTELNVPDSAYKYYYDVIENHPGSVYEGQTLFALGSYYAVKGDSLKADSLFNVVYENFRTESVVNAAAHQLKKPLINLNFDPAEELYIEAEQNMLNNVYDSSIVKFYNIFETYPESPLAPKALYAGGWILERELNLPDSAAVFYDSIAANYPLSEFSSRILPKLNVYKQDKALKQQAIEDSLAALDSRDTVAADTTQRQLAPDVSPSDTSRTFEQIDRSMDINPKDTLRIEDAEPNIYGDPEYFDEPELPKDSLQLLHEVITDSLQGKDRRGIDSTFAPPLDSLIPGKPVDPGGGTP